MRVRRANQPLAMRHATAQKKRLLHDWAEVQNNPLPTVTAQPLERDLFEWHANLRGPQGTLYENGIFHLILNFPQTYPRAPPTVTVCTTLPHQNVFGSTLCLDMLETGGAVEEYRGWSTAYTVQQVLVQLQAFLFEEPPPGVKEAAIKQAVRDANNFSCSSCSHSPYNRWPTFQRVEDNAFTLIKSELEIIESELTCFFTKVPYDKTVLGVGINVRRNIRSGALQSIDSSIDLLSIRAFMKDNIRHSAANQSFTHWLPLYINPAHGEKAYPLAKRALSMICVGQTNHFKPSMALEVLTKLMSTMVASVMKGKIHASAVALQGYVAFHQLLLKFIQEYPELKAEADSRLGNFINNPETRDKEIVPSLGDLLILLTVTDKYSWADLQEPYFIEMHKRHAFWIAKRYPELVLDDEAELANLDPRVEEERLAKSFSTAEVGLGLLAFLVEFVDNVARPKGKSLSQVLAGYDSRFGRVTSEVENHLQVASKTILKISNWSELYSAVGVANPPSDEELAKRLRTGMIDSLKCKYRGVVHTAQSSEEWARAHAAAQTPLRSLLKDSKGVALASEAPMGKLGPLPAGISLSDDEAMWQNLSKTRWGVHTLSHGYAAATAAAVALKAAVAGAPYEPVSAESALDVARALGNSTQAGPAPGPVNLPHPTTWREYYLVHNLLDIIAHLPDNPDFPALYEALDLSAPYITHFELPLFVPEGLKSKWFYVNAVVSRLTNLRVVRVSGDVTGLEKGALRELNKALLSNGSISALDIRYTRIDSKKNMAMLESGLVAAKALTVLDLSGNKLGNQGAQALGKILDDSYQFTELYLTNCGLDASAAKAIASGITFHPGMKKLKIDKNPMLHAGLTAMLNSVAGLVRLESFDASQITLRSGNSTETTALAEALVRIFKHKTVQHVSFWKTPLRNALNDKALEYIGSARSAIHTLDLGETGASNNIFERFKLFKDNVALKNLDLSTNGLSTPGLRRLIELTSVFGGLRITRLDLRANNSLTSGYNNQTEEKRGKIVGDLLSVFPALTELRLDNCSIPSDAGKYLGPALAKTTSLRVLHLENNRLGPEGTRAVLEGLIANPGVVHELYLANNKIGVKGARAVGQYLAAPGCALRKLSVYNNKIAVEGCLNIAEGLAKNSSLIELDVGANAIKGKGINSIAQAAAKHEAFSVLHSRFNSISDGGAKTLFGNLSKASFAPALRYLALGQNSISDIVLPDLLKSLRESTRPQSLETDLTERVRLIDPDVVARTVYITPVATSITPEQLKKHLLKEGCGFVHRVSIFTGQKDSTGRRVRGGLSSNKFAFVEFADKDSVAVALDLYSIGKTYLAGSRFHVYRAGTGSGEVREATDAKAAPTHDQAWDLL